MKTVLKKMIIGLFAVVLCLSAFSCGDKDDYVPAGFKRASDKNADYALYVPEGWVVDTSTGVTIAKVSENDTSNISFMGFELDDAIINVETPKGTDEGETEGTTDSGEVPKIDTLDQFWAYYSAEFKKTFPDIAYETEGENMLVSKIPAKKYIYTATVTGREYKFMQIVIINNGTVYLLTYTAQKDVFEEHLSKVLSIAEYLEIE